ncbi:hypothetical protein ABZ356_26780 [Micromonospora zamorensis]|uniref:hypothetical protein n=1 Tax=Micromonospora zamorensis TaxID=709883 RepID=UPI00340F4D4D
MTFWLAVQPRDAPCDLGVDVAGYQASVHSFVSSIEVALQRAVDGATWLRRSFPARSYLRLDLTAHTGAEPSVRHVRTRGQGGAKEIRYLVGLPVAWFAVPGDGLLALRIFRALLGALAAVGVEQGLGTPPVRVPGSYPGRPELVDLFVPPADRHAGAAVTADRVREVIDGMEPDQLVLAATVPATRAVRRDREVVVRALGAVVREFEVRGDGKEGVRIWVVRQDG